MSDHGVIVPLSDEQAQRFIDCYAGYNVLSHRTTLDAAGSWTDSIRKYDATPNTVMVLRKSRTHLG
jgi:hypothetical protein